MLEEKKLAKLPRRKKKYKNKHNLRQKKYIIIKQMYVNDISVYDLSSVYTVGDPRGFSHAGVKKNRSGF